MKIRTDITNKKFNKLTALNFSHRENGRDFWNFQCDCGNQKIIKVKEVKNSHIKSCGCLKHIDRYVDLTGNKYEMLLVLNYSYKKDKYHYFSVKCNCGNNKIVRGADLKSGRTTSCGCKRFIPKLDFTKKYGKLTIIKNVNFQKPGNYVKCLCDCGNIKLLNASSILKGTTSSCGCLKKGAKRINLEGKVFGLLTVLEYSYTNKFAFWKVQCKCGTIKTVNGSTLKQGVMSCGCRSRGSQTTGTIYGIYDINNILVYIGQTVKYQLKDRLSCHISKPCSKNLKIWFDSINYLPTIKPIMKNVPIAILNYAEKKAIYFYKNKINLLNTIHNKINRIG